MSQPDSFSVSRQHSHGGILFGLARAEPSHTLYCGAADGDIYVGDAFAEKWEPTQFHGHRGYVTSVALAGEKTLVSAASDKSLIWWDLEKQTPIRTVKAHEKWIRCVTTNPDASLVASVADDMVCRLWHAPSGELSRELKGHEARTPNHFPSMLYACAFSPDGAHIATADRLGHVVVWETASGKVAATLDAPLMYTWDGKARTHSIGGIRSIAFSPDGRLIAVGGINQIGNIDHLDALARVEVFDWQNNERTHEFQGDEFKGLVECLQFGPNGSWLLAAGGDHNGFIKLFDLETSKIIKQEKAPMHIHDLALNETFDTIYAVGHGKVVVWALS